jgi:hypothetical protein
MPDFFTDNPLAIHYAIPVFVVLLLVEIGVAVYHQRDWYDTPDTLSSLAMGIGNAVIRLFTKFITLGVFFFLYQFRLFDLGAAYYTFTGVATRSATSGPATWYTTVARSTT